MVNQANIMQQNSDSMNKIIFFAQTRELVGVNKLELAVEQKSISQLLEQLSLRGKDRKSVV